MAQSKIKSWKRWLRISLENESWVLVEMIVSALSDLFFWNSLWTIDFIADMKVHPLDFKMKRKRLEIFVQVQPSYIHPEVIKKLVQTDPYNSNQKPTRKSL